MAVLTITVEGIGVKVILFGSYARAKTHEDSDIDLLVVLDEDFVPKNYDGWLTLKVRIRKALREVNNEVTIDLLVYTKPQYEMLRTNMNSFQKEIHETGKVLYEKAG